MGNWVLDYVSVVWDEDAPENEPAEEGVAGIDLYRTDVESDFDPADHTVDEVRAYVDEHPDEADAILDAERDGKGRVTLIEYLEQNEDE